MKSLAALTFAFSLALPNSTYASVRTIFVTQAQGTNGSITTLEVAPGHGLNINLIPTQEVVKKAWIDDPSRITLSFDGNLCQPSNEQQECTNEGASVVHLRQIKPIDFPHLPRSSSGSTLLTLVTQGVEGRRLYQFKVVPIAKEAKYTTITITPNPEKLAPLVSNQIPSSNWQPQQVANRNISSKNAVTAAVSPVDSSTSDVLQPTISVTKQSFPPSAQTIDDLRAVRAGLLVARKKQQINFDTSVWKQAQSAIIWLSRGSSREEAAEKSGLPISILAQLINWGQQAP